MIKHKCLWVAEQNLGFSRKNFLTLSFYDADFVVHHGERHILKD